MALQTCVTISGLGIQHRNRNIYFCGLIMCIILQMLPSLANFRAQHDFTQLNGQVNAYCCRAMIFNLDNTF